MEMFKNNYFLIHKKILSLNDQYLIFHNVIYYKLKYCNYIVINFIQYHNKLLIELLNYKIILNNYQSLVLNILIYYSNYYIQYNVNLLV